VQGYIVEEKKDVPSLCSCLYFSGSPDDYLVIKLKKIKVVTLKQIIPNLEKENSDKPYLSSLIVMWRIEVRQVKS